MFTWLKKQRPPDKTDTPITAVAGNAQDAEAHNKLGDIFYERREFPCGHSRGRCVPAPNLRIPRVSNDVYTTSLERSVLVGCNRLQAQKSTYVSRDYR